MREERLESGFQASLHCFDETETEKGQQAGSCASGLKRLLGRGGRRIKARLVNGLIFDAMAMAMTITTT